MSDIKRKPTSPGEILEEEFLKPLKISQSMLARHLGCDVKVINRIINGHSGVSAAMSLRLAGAFKTTPGFWLNAQQAVDLYQAARSVKKSTRPIVRRRLQGFKAA